MAERMRIDDALKFFPKINPLFFLANRTAWKGEITGPDFVCKHSAARRIRRVSEVMEVVVCGGF